MKDFPSKNIRELLESEFVTEPTRKALSERLDYDRNYEPQFFGAKEFDTLKAVCDALAPSKVVPCDFVAGEIDKRLVENTGNGWRYNELPPDADAYRIALPLFDQAARRIYADDFAKITNEQRIEIVRKMLDSSGGKMFDKVPPKFSLTRFFEEIFAEYVELFYSHPLVLEEIGYIGFADARGWDLEVSSSKFKVQGRENELRITNYELQEKEIQNPKSDVVDAVVIGTGAGGAPILARLAQAGLKVVALEAGKSFDYREFPTDERAQAKLFWTDERLSAGSNAVAFGNNNSGCGVGGSTLHFTAYTPRPQADDFRIFSDFGVGLDWCLSYEDLEPYFNELEWFLGVSGASPYPWGKPRKKGYPLPPLPLNAAARLMQTACERLNIKTAPAPNAALSQDYFEEKIGWRRACTNRGFCQAGCSTGAKGSMDTTFLPLAVHHGAEIRSECFVTEFEFDSQGEIKAVVYSQNGEMKKQPCKNVFLCAGGIETPRLLLINDLANSSGQVGKNFMAHTGVQVWGTFDEEIYPHKGIPGGLISEDTHRPKNADFAGGYLLQSIGVMPVTYVSQLARGEKVFGAELGDWMNDYNRTAGINILGDCLPHANNFMELSDEKDARGLPKPRVYFSHGENENRMTRHAEKLMSEIWTAAGAKKMWTFQRNAHIIGTCRMGTDAGDSVVDENCRSFDIPNLYICDNSVFPSALSVNPALTIMALALRTADCFLKGRI
ncbi:MAG TPA: GMC family oxidoreductase [Pyrinomonadaceae bacterium]|nr:GMC family oxidoreductase [Pyrinomonadaceae bacterium]